MSSRFNPFQAEWYKLRTANTREQYELAGMLAYAQGWSESYGVHNGMRSTRQAAAEAFAYGYAVARYVDVRR